jgi:hypothetical protein
MKQKLLLFIFMTSIILFSCSASKNVEDNNLNEQEKKDEYTLLFDGQSMNGWRAYQNKGIESWSADSGTLHSKGTMANYGEIAGDLMTTEEFENFDLSVDWKISPKGNSGIIYMVKEDTLPSYECGP